MPPHVVQLQHRALSGGPGFKLALGWCPTTVKYERSGGGCHTQLASAAAADADTGGLDGLSVMGVGMLSASYLPGRFRTLKISSLLPVVSHSLT